MTSITTAEQLAQRASDVDVLDERQLQSVWGELGTRSVGLKEFAQLLLRKGLLTNYQLERLLKGHKTGFFFGDYKALYLVGSGTFARVYRAAHRVSNKLYAVKVLRQRHSSDPREAELFRREGELGQSLKHRNIVQIHEVNSARGEHFIVMDFIEGRNLREFFKVRKRFDPIDASNIMADVLAGLHYAFGQGVTHRDLKMSNILVSSSGVAMLVDFGLAGLEPDEGSDAESMNPRTIDYAGLERATSVRKDDTRSDIFFAGCIFYQMLSGRPALSETRERVQRLAKSRYQDIPSLGKVAPDVPPPITMVVNKAIEFDPQRRYQTPGEMLAELKLAIKRAQAGGEAAAGAADELANAEGRGPDGEPRKLMVVESSIKRQDVLRDLFKRNGYRVLVTIDPGRALRRLRDDPSAADIVVFCSGEIGKDALEVFNQFGAEPATRDLPSVLLLDEAQAGWKEHAQTAEHRRVLAMPIKLRELREAVLGALMAGNTA